MKRWLKILLIVLLVIVLLIGGYLAYVLISYHRIGDMALTPEGSAAAAAAETERDYTLLSWNIGFGAYTADYDFFMDGGKQSRAESPERLAQNLTDIGAVLNTAAPDFCFLQEVDFDGTRSYHVDERAAMRAALNAGYCSVAAQNYDSPYLCYPLYAPHGANKSCIMTFSAAAISAAQRVELPVEKGFTKLLDLDRCYTVSRIPCGARELVLYNLHLTAYSSDGSIATRQLELLLDDMAAEYAAGNWCIAGGDFNKDILGDSAAWFGAADQEYSWAQPIDEAQLARYETLVFIAPLDADDPVPSCRNPDSAYHARQYVLTVDGFLVSENVEVLGSEVVDLGFAYSDHNPVRLQFRLTAP